MRISPQTSPYLQNLAIFGEGPQEGLVRNLTIVLMRLQTHQRDFRLAALSLLLRRHQFNLYQSLMNSLSRAIKRLDIFGQPINLNLDQKSKYQSYFGGLISIFVILLLFAYTANEIVGYTTQRGVQITQETKFSYDPDLLELSSKNFIFAIRVESEAFYAQPEFDIEMYQIFKDQKKPLNLQKCTQQQFEKVLGEKVTPLIKAYEIENWLCPSNEFMLQLEGTQQSENYKEIRMQVKQCQETASWGSPCKRRLDNNSSTYQLQLLTKNTFINPFNNEFVAEDYLDNSMSLYFEPGQLQRIEYLFHKHITADFEGQIKIEGLLDEQTFQVMNSNSYNQIYQGKSDGIFVQIRFRRSNFLTNYNRQYQTVTDLLSKIGGLSSSVVSIVGLLIRYYNRALFYLDLSNRLYDFDFATNSPPSTKESRFWDHQQPQTQAKKKRVRKSKPKGDEGEQHHNDEEQNNDDQTVKVKTENEDSLMKDPAFKEKVEKVVEAQKQIMKHYSFRNKKHFLLSPFQQLILNKEQIKLSISYFLYKLLCSRKAKKHQKHLYMVQKSIGQIQQELDVFAILSRIHQLEKLKNILFDRDQLTLFNYSPKPVITLYDQADNNNFLVYSKTYKEGKKDIYQIAESIKIQMKQQYKNKSALSVEDVYNSYKAVTEKNRSSTRFYYKINNKLKDFLGDQLKAIFKASKLLQFDDDLISQQEGLGEIESVPPESSARCPYIIKAHIK